MQTLTEYLPVIVFPLVGGLVLAIFSLVAVIIALKAGLALYALKHGRLPQRVQALRRAWQPPHAAGRARPRTRRLVLPRRPSGAAD